MEKIPLAKLSAFLDWESDLQQGEPVNCEKIISSNLFIDVNNKKHAKNHENFSQLKCKIYPHQMLNISKGVIRNRELLWRKSEPL